MRILASLVLGVLIFLIAQDRPNFLLKKDNMIYSCGWHLYRGKRIYAVCNGGMIVKADKYIIEHLR